MDALGYVDAFRLARAPEAASPGEPLPDDLRASCWAGTRIDYVWASGAFLGRHAVKAARYVQSDASDHHAVVIDFARSGE